MRALDARLAMVLTLIVALAGCGGSDDVPPTADAVDDTTTADTETDASPAPDTAPEPDVRPSDITEPEVTPDATPDAEPDVEPDAVPDVEPDVEPDVVPDVEPDAEPDVPVDPGPADCTLVGRLDAAIARDAADGLGYAFDCDDPVAALAGSWSWTAAHPVDELEAPSSALTSGPVWDEERALVLVSIPVPDADVTGRWDLTIVDPDGVAHAAELRVRVTEDEVAWPPGQGVVGLPPDGRLVRVVGSAWSEERFALWSRGGRLGGAALRGDRAGRSVAIDLPIDPNDDLDAPTAGYRMHYQHTEFRGTPVGAIFVWAGVDRGALSVRLWSVTDEGGEPLGTAQPVATESIGRIHDVLLVRADGDLTLAVLSSTTTRRARVDLLPVAPDGVRPPPSSFAEYNTLGPWVGRSDVDAFQFWPLVDPSPVELPVIEEVGIRVAEASANGAFRMAVVTAPRDASTPVERGRVEGQLALTTPPPEGQPPRIRLSAAPWGRRDDARAPGTPPRRGAVWFGFAPYDAGTEGNGALALHDDGGLRPTFQGDAVLFPAMPIPFTSALHEGHLTAPDEDGRIAVHGAKGAGVFAAELTVCRWSTATCSRDTNVLFERRLPPTPLTMRAWPDPWGHEPWVVQYGAAPIVVGSSDHPLAFDERAVLQPVGDRVEDGPFTFHRQVSCRDFVRGAPTCSTTVRRVTVALAAPSAPYEATVERGAEDRCVSAAERGTVLCGETDHFLVAPSGGGGRVDPIRLDILVQAATALGMVPVTLADEGVMVDRVVYAHQERGGPLTWRLAELTGWDGAVEPRGDGVLAFRPDQAELGNVPTGLPLPPCTGDPFSSPSPLCPRVLHRLEPGPDTTTGIPLRMHRDLVALVERPELDAACPVVLARWRDGDIDAGFDILSQGTGVDCAGLHVPLGAVALPIRSMHWLAPLRGIGAPTGAAFRAWEARWSTTDALLTFRLPGRGDAEPVADATLWVDHLRRTDDPDTLPVQITMPGVVDRTSTFGFPRVTDINGDGLHDVLAFTEPPPGDGGRWVDVTTQGSFSYFRD